MLVVLTPSIRVLSAAAGAMTFETIARRIRRDGVRISSGVNPGSTLNSCW